MKKIIFLILIFGFIKVTISQNNKYWVMFKNKNGTPYSVATPTAYLTAKSILRRSNQGIAINISDLPVTPAYVTQIAAVPSVTVLYRSKWMNGIVVLTNTTAIASINTFTFVNSTNQVNKYKISLPVKINEEQDPNELNSNKISAVTSYSYGGANWQQKMIGADCLHNLGYRGQGMTIAVLDDGFDQVNTNPIFDSLFLQNRLLGTRDFVTGDTMVFEDDTHGAWCLSTMAGLKPGKIIGTAPKANYWLLRTEDVSTETISEEYNWIRGAEFADSVGADVCTTSLGYTQFDVGAPSLNNHVYADLNGKTAPMSIAANMAARKGMIVLNAAGNEGTSGWFFIAVPSDADSIITVGAVDSLGNHANFSSYGPTSDGRTKPDLSARGQKAYVCGPGVSCFFGNGTSFATPVLAGAVTCLWQSRKFATSQQIIKALRATASNSASPNNSIGWGIPNMCTAASSTLLSVENLKNESSEFKLFPNPFTNELKISLSRIEKNISISICDVLGKNIYLEEIDNPSAVISLNPANLFNTGVYFITISSPSFIITKKIMKQ